MDESELIDAFLGGSPHAVVGASNDRSKYGNKVLRAYRQNKMPVFAVNPHVRQVEGQDAFPDLASLPEKVHGISVIVPPAVTLGIIEQAAELGIRHIWLQPGAESPDVLARAAELGIEPIAEGPCLLVALRFREA